MEGQFPAGLRVLVVDDDMTCLKVLDRMLRKCCYHVTTCNQATVALNLLRAQKGCFDVVLSDVHMPDMDGYKLLEQVGLEMDLPVIMMSADQRTSAVMKGIKHGACDYLIKPIREEELKIIWQHVFRKQCSGTREAQTSEDSDHHRKGSYDADIASSINEGTEGMFKIQRKKRDAKEDDDAELENDDPSNSKRPRVVWSVELHQQFVSAVNQLGIDKAVPKRILELMSVPGLTRENVASHLQGCSGPVRTNANVKLLKDIGGLNNNLEDTMSRQESLLKFRLYLKRLSGVAQQGGNSLCGLMDPAVQIGASGGRFDVQALAASGQISPHTLAALHNELYGQPTGSIMLSTMDQQALLQASLQGSNGIPVEHGLSLRQPPMKSQPNISKHYPQPVLPEEGVSSVFGAWSTNSLSAVGHNGNAVTSSAQNVNIVKDIVQQKCMSLDSSRTINVQPSCLVIPSGSSVSFQAENGPASIDQKNGHHRSIVNMISSQPNMPSPVSGLNPFPTGILTGYSGHRETSSSSRQSDGFSRQLADSTMNFGASRQLQGMAPNMRNIQRPYDTVSFEKMDQQLLKTISCDGNGSSTLSRFAVDEFGSSTSNFNHGKTCGDTNGIGNKVKQEQNMDFVDNAKLGVPMFLNFSTNDIMRVFYE